MGIGWALAQGLVGGFTKNIDRVQAKRDKDDAKVDALEGQLTTALLQPADKRPSLDSISSIQGIIKDAKSQQANRGKIDAFGRAEKPLNLDVMKTANLINQVDQGYLDFGGYKMPVNKLYGSKTLMGKPFEQGNLFMRAIDTHVSDPTNRAKFIMHLKNNKAAMSQFKGKFGIHSRLFLNGYTDLFTKEADKQKAYTQLSDNFTNLQLIKDYMPDGNYSSLEAVESSAANSSLLKGIKPSKGQIWFQGQNDEGVKLAIPYELKGEDYTALKNMSDRMGYSRPSEFIFDFQSFVPELVLQDGEDPKTMYNYIFDSIELQKMNFAGRTITEAQKKKQAEFLINRYGNNRGRMSLAVLPLIANVGNANTLLERNGNRVRGIERAREIEQIFDLKTGEITKVTENYKDMLAVRNDLTKLINLKKRLDTGAGLVQNIGSIITGIVGDGGQIEQAVAILSSSDGADGFDEKEGSDAIQRYLSKYKSEGSDQEKLGQIDSLVISLAARMARAVDPAGRLSNQDFEVQLRRLGSAGIFTNRPRQLSALNETLADFQGQLNRLKVINDITTRTRGGGRELSRMERRQLFADRAISNLLQDAGVEAFTAVSQRQFSYSQAKSENRVNVAPNYLGANGETVEILFDKNDNQVSGLYFVNGTITPRDQIQFVPNQSTATDIQRLNENPGPNISVVGNDPATESEAADTKALIQQQSKVKEQIKAAGAGTASSENQQQVSGTYSENDVATTNPNGDGTFDITLKSGEVIKNVKRSSDGNSWVGS